MMVPIFLAMKYFNYSPHIAFFEAMLLHIYRLQCRVNVTVVCTRKEILRVPRFIMMLTLLPGLDPNCGISRVCVHLLLAQLLCVCVWCHLNTKTGPDTDTHTHWCTPPVPGQLYRPRASGPAPEHQVPPPSNRSRPRVVPSSRLRPLPKLTKSGRPDPRDHCIRKGHRHCALLERGTRGLGCPLTWRRRREVALSPQTH